MPVRSGVDQISRRTLDTQKKVPGKENSDEHSRCFRGFLDVPVDPNESHNFCYTVGQLVVVDFRSTFMWSKSPGFWGATSAAAGHAHGNTTIKLTKLLDDGKQKMTHVKVVDR